MGNVLTGKYQISLSAWNWLIERDSILDFVPIVKDFQIMAVVPSPPEVDPGNNSSDTFTNLEFQIYEFFIQTSQDFSPDPFVMMHGKLLVSSLWLVSL